MSTPEAIVVGLAGAFFVACLLLGVLYPGTGANRLLKPVRKAEEPDETAALLAATNAKRAAKGKPPLSREDLGL
ncbi:MAG TPA: hypothetical protein VFR97_10910 [Capillimicrobium sp.]|nr:hypothetical protein [Capillimicrobium sp.]